MSDLVGNTEDSFLTSFSYTSRMTPLIAVCLLSLLSGINAQGGGGTRSTGAAISRASPTGSAGIHHAGLYAPGVPSAGYPASGMVGTPMSMPGVGTMPGTSMSYMSPGAPMSTGGLSAGGMPAGTYTLGGTSTGSMMPGVSMHSAGATSMGGMPAGTYTLGGLSGGGVSAGSMMPGVSMYGAGTRAGATSTGGVMSTHGVSGTGSTHGVPGLSYRPTGTVTSAGTGSHSHLLSGGSPMYTAVGSSRIPSHAGGTHMAFGSGTSMGSAVIPSPMHTSGFGASTGTLPGYGMGLPGTAHARMGGPAYHATGMTGVSSRGFPAGRRGSVMPGAPRETMIGGQLGFRGRHIGVTMGGAGAGRFYEDGIGPFGSGSSGMFGSGMPGMMSGGVMMPGMAGAGMFGMPRRSLGTTFTGPFGMRGITGGGGTYGYRGIRPMGLF